MGVSNSEAVKAKSNFAYSLQYSIVSNIHTALKIISKQQAAL